MKIKKIKLLILNDLDSNDFIQVRSGYFVFITRNLNDIDSQENKSKGNSMNMNNKTLGIYEPIEVKN